MEHFKVLIDIADVWLFMFISILLWLSRYLICYCFLGIGSASAFPGAVHWIFISPQDLLGHPWSYFRGILMVSHKNTGFYTSRFNLFPFSSGVWHGMQASGPAKSNDGLLKINLGHWLVVYNNTLLFRLTIGFKTNCL